MRFRSGSIQDAELEYHALNVSVSHLIMIDYNFRSRNEYLFTVTGVKKMKWFLSLTRHISLNVY